eukprot:TRINITY_DN2772_c0_g1_i8.p1 TRINITY_DN2772_c0_g1~~TRINITY_DN2772_c0_g1_i8.p1  ORF type:complete len:202 (-),score=16.50 TRINITY_DN2772_c0_g1_i8:59-586(-)
MSQHSSSSNGSSSSSSSSSSSHQTSSSSDTVRPISKLEAMKTGKFVKVFWKKWPDEEPVGKWRVGQITGFSAPKLGGSHLVFYGSGDDVYWKPIDKRPFGFVDDEPPDSLSGSSQDSLSFGNSDSEVEIGSSGSGSYIPEGQSSGSGDVMATERVVRKSRNDRIMDYLWYYSIRA